MDLISVLEFFGTSRYAPRSSSMLIYSPNNSCWGNFTHVSDLCDLYHLANKAAAKVIKGLVVYHIR